MTFLNPNQKLATGKTESRDDGLVSKTLHCQTFTRDLLTLLLIICPAIVLGSTVVIALLPMCQFYMPIELIR